MPNFHPWSDYIIRRGTALALALAIAALIMGVWADARPETFLLLRRYIEGLHSSAQGILGAALLGGLVLEDALRKGRS